MATSAALPSPSLPSRSIGIGTRHDRSGASGAGGKRHLRHAAPSQRRGVRRSQPPTSDAHNEQSKHIKRVSGHEVKRAIGMYGGRGRRRVKDERGARQRGKDGVTAQAVVTGWLYEVRLVPSGAWTLPRTTSVILWRVKNMQIVDN